MRAIYPHEWSQRQEGDKNIIELEGKTKNLLQSLVVDGPDGKMAIPLIPEFQGTWMKVRITVELVPGEQEER